MRDFLTFSYPFTPLILTLILSLTLAKDQSYTDVQLHSNNEWRLEKLDLVMEVEAFVRPWLSRKNFPEYLHILHPKSAISTNTSRQTLMDQLTQLQEQLVQITGEQNEV